MPLVQGTEVPKTKLIRGKACRNCTGPVPKSSNPANTKKRDFCSENCRKEFHKNNGISVHRLKVQVRQWVREEVRADLVRIGLVKIQ
jgi:hypothetical protein